jgi:peptidoglycan/LPS O-acetylase OafA/YrhL
MDAGHSFLGTEKLIKTQSTNFPKFRVPDAKDKIFFPNLDGLRFFSFFVVFLAHSFATKNEAIQASGWYKILKVRLFSDGDLGVSFFFVLSGFLITYLLLAEKEKTGRIDIRSFYVRRVLRIWPLYFIVGIFGFFLFPIFKTFFGGVPDETANPLLCFTFLNNFDRMAHIPDSSVLSVLWSVAIEEQFYVIWPVLFYIVPRKYYVHLIGSIILFSNLFRLIAYNRTNIDIHTFGVITDMGVGGAAALLCYSNKPFLDRIRNLSLPVIALPYVVTIGFICFRHEIFATEAMSILKRLLMGLTFALIILEQNYAKRSFFKMGNQKLPTALGKYTYGLYCLHQIGLLVAATLFGKLALLDTPTGLFFLAFPFSLLFTIGISWVSYHYFEKHFLKLKERFAHVRSGR